MASAAVLPVALTPDADAAYPGSALAPSPEQIRAMKERHAQDRMRLVERFEAGGTVSHLLRGLSRVTDRLIAQCARMTRVSDFATVVAVGGYGRAELFPYSDVDLLIVPVRDCSGPEDRQLAHFVQILWDLGLAIGHSVRTPPQCAEQAVSDATIMTSMLETRRICGPVRGYEQFREEVGRVMNARDFYRAKILEQQQRHTKFEDTPYSLEPNCKESPGGLRDLHILLWVARAAGMGQNWDDMMRSGLLTANECERIKRTERHLKRVRARLHIVARRREDRLVFDLQHTLATAFDMRATAQWRPSEVFMKSYYQAAKIVTQINSLVLPAVEERLFPENSGVSEPLEGEFHVRAERLDIVDETLFRRDPGQILQAFVTWQRHGEIKAMTPRLLRAIWNSAELMNAEWRNAPANRERFLSVFRHQDGTLHTVRLMNQWSVLGAYLPAFRRIVGQMQHDLFHVYTVDQHILMVLRNLRRFQSSDFAHEYPHCSQLIANFDQPWLLLLAALFHDIAKGRGGDHSELGSVDARRFCRQHGLGRDETDLVCFLVEQHLTMSRVAQKEDLADPLVINRFAQRIGSDRRLVALYLLTVADVRGTSPKVWNAWKARLLDDLFRKTQRVLGGGSIGAEAELEGRKRESLDILKLYGLSAHAHEKLWKQLDVVYFLRHSARDIAWHARCLLVHVDSPRPIIRTRLAPGGEGIEVLVYSSDNRNLFLRVCGFFDKQRVSILDAKIHTTRHGYALDTFLVSDPVLGTNLRNRLESLESDLTAWLERRDMQVEPARGRLSRHSRHFPVAPAVHLAPDDSGQHHMLSIIATDRVGLLFSVAQVLMNHEVDLLTAKITTLGERVEDVFLIKGRGLVDARAQIQLETDLLKVLEPI